MIEYTWRLFVCVYVSLEFQNHLINFFQDPRFDLRSKKDVSLAATSNQISLFLWDSVSGSKARILRSRKYTYFQFCVKCLILPLKYGRIYGEFKFPAGF